MRNNGLAHDKVVPILGLPIEVGPSLEDLKGLKAAELDEDTGLALILGPWSRLRPLAEPRQIEQQPAPSTKGRTFIVQQMIEAKDEAAQAACCRLHAAEPAIRLRRLLIHEGLH